MRSIHETTNQATAQHRRVKETDEHKEKVCKDVRTYERNAMNELAGNRTIRGITPVPQKLTAVDRNLSNLIAGSLYNLTAASNPRRLIAASNNVVVASNLLAQIPAVHITMPSHLRSSLCSGD